MNYYSKELFTIQVFYLQALLIIQLVLDPDEAEHTQMETYPSQSSDTSIPDLELNENLRVSSKRNGALADNL